MGPKSAGSKRAMTASQKKKAAKPTKKLVASPKVAAKTTARRQSGKSKAPEHEMEKEADGAGTGSADCALVDVRGFRQRQSSFLMYLNAGKKAKNPEHQASCSELKDWYGGLSQEKKREVIKDFFAAGGKKPGVDKLMTVSMVATNKSNLRHLSNWATPRAIGTHHAVAHLTKNQDPDGRVVARLASEMPILRRDDVALAPGLAPPPPKKKKISRRMGVGFADLGPLCAQVKPEDVGGIDEFKKWVEKKVAASDQEHPHDKVHQIDPSCWMASEYWYTFMKGVVKDRSEEVVEKMEKGSKKPELLPANEGADVKLKVNRLLAQSQKPSKAASRQMGALQKALSLGDLCACWLKKNGDEQKRGRFKTGLAEVRAQVTPKKENKTVEVPVQC